MRARKVAAALLLTGAMAACDGDTTVSQPPAAPDTLVLRTQELRSGPAPWERGQLPDFSLYGGGRVIIHGEPAGALRQAREYRLPAQEFEQLVADAEAAGLDEAHTYEDTDTSDASLLLVSLRTADGMRTNRISAPEARGTDRVVDFVEHLPGPPPTAMLFQPTAVAVLATAGVSDGPTMSWPLHPLTGGTRTSEGTCTVVTGDALTAAIRLAKSAEEQTRWSSDGTLYAVSFRPLLPDEHTCQDIDLR